MTPVLESEKSECECPGGEERRVELLRKRHVTTRQNNDSALALSELRPYHLFN